MRSEEGEVVGMDGEGHPAGLERLAPDAYRELCAHLRTLEQHYRDLCDIEFTIERGKLWMLQTRVGKRTAGAAFRIATQLVDQGLIGLDEAVTRVTGDQLAQLIEAPTGHEPALMPLTAMRTIVRSYAE